MNSRIASTTARFASTLVLACATTPTALAQGGFFSFDNSAVQGAEAEANAELGTTVDVEYGTGSGSTVGLGFNHVDDRGTHAETVPDDEGGTRMIIVDSAQVAEDLPEVKGNKALQEIFLKHLFLHEFRHCASAEGGLDRPGGGGCSHILDFKNDAAEIEEDILDTKNDPNLSAAEKCERISLLCKLYKRAQEQANKPEAIAQAFMHCDHLLVTPAQEVIVADSEECPPADCPVPETDFGVAD